MRGSREPRAGQRGDRAAGSASRSVPARGREPARHPLDVGRRRGIAANSARELPDTHSRERAVEPFVAVELEHPAEQLEAERRRLGMHAVRAPMVTVSRCSCARAMTAPAAFDAVANEGAGTLDRQRERGVEDVGRGEPEVEPAPVGPDVGRHDVDERCDVVVGGALDLGHARRARNACVLADAARARADTTPPQPTHPEPRAPQRAVRASPRPTRPRTSQVWRRRSPRRF